MISRKGQNGVQTAGPVKATSFNVAENLLKNTTAAKREAEEREIKTAAKRNLDEELRDMLDVAKNTKAALREIDEAFTGNQAYDVLLDDVSKKVKLKNKKRSGTLDVRNGTAPQKKLEPIDEAEERNDEYALVPVTYGN